jgi:hypothetical protein
VYYGDSTLYNDEVRFEQTRASRKAALNWRFRNVGRNRTKALDKLWHGTVQALRAAAHAARRRIDRTREWPPRTLLEQR